MASHPSHTPYSSSAPSSFLRQAPPPCTNQGQSRIVSRPSSRLPTRKKSIHPEDSTGINTPVYVSRPPQALTSVAGGQFAWATFDGMHTDRRHADSISQMYFLVLVTSVGPGDEISLLFLYHCPPASMGEHQLPPALRPKPHHSLVLNATAAHVRNCVVPGVKFRDMHVWTAPPVTAKVAEVNPGCSPPVTVPDRELYAIKKHAQVDQVDRNNVFHEAYNAGSHHCATLGHWKEARVRLYTDIHTRGLQSVTDPCVLLGYLYAGAR